MARIPYLDEEKIAPEVRDTFRRLTGRGAIVANVYQMMAHSPSCCLPFMRLGGALLQKASLDAKLRELAILRVARLTGSEYEWQQHTALARHAGVSADQEASIDNWDASEAFDEREKAVLRYVDEITRNVAVDDVTFDAVRAQLNETALVELTLSIGFWGMVARLLVPLQIDLEKQAASVEDLFGTARAK